MKGGLLQEQSEYQTATIIIDWGKVIKVLAVKIKNTQNANDGGL